MRNLAIVWRNPAPTRHIRRWQALARDARRNVYVVQQLVHTGSYPEWSNTACLEVVHGKKSSAVRAVSPAKHLGWLLPSMHY